MLPRMRLAVLVLACLGCQAGAPAPKISAGTPLAKDLAAICNAVERSGAAALEPADQAYTIAQWLPDNVSEDGRQWLVRWAKLGDDRAARLRMLEADARAAGVLDCPLLALW
jgi:cell division inhibitor SulA